jgi:hypothetical protein
MHIEPVVADKIQSGLIASLSQQDPVSCVLPNIFYVIKGLQPGTVAHTCNPSYLGGRDRNTAV